MSDRDDSPAEITLKAQQEAFENPTPLNFDDLQAEIENKYKVWRKTPIFMARSPSSQLETLKSTSKANYLRHLGDVKYLDGFYDEAIQLYTQSIAFAVNESEELALAYAGRSTSHYLRGRLVECLLDVNRSLQGKYSETHKARLEGLKKDCLAMIRRPSEQDPQFKLIQGNETDPIDAMKNPADDEEWRRRMCIFGNPFIPSASPKIKLEYDERWGRHMVATENIEPGEILSCQKYFTTNLLPEGEYKNCSYCLLRCYALVPCSLCTEMYCSKACCLRAEGSYHYMECKMIRSQKVSYSEWLPSVSCLMLRALLVGTKQGAQLKSLMETMKLRDIFVENSDVRNKPFVDDYLSVLRLCRTYNAGIIKVGIFCVLEMVDLLQHLGFFESATTEDPAISSKTDENCLNEKQLFVAMLLLNHYNSLISNIFNVVEFTDTFKLTPSQSVKRVGVGVCPLHGLLNHSCNPNSYFFTRYRENVVFAIRPIRKGEQIFITYFSHFCEQTREVRKEQLMTRGVVCQCEPCVNNWPLITYLKEHTTGIFRKERVNALFYAQLWPPILRIVKLNDENNLSDRILWRFVCEVLKFLHANVSSPSYIIVVCETQLLVLTVLLYNESCPHLRHATLVKRMCNLISNCLFNEIGLP